MSIKTNQIKLMVVDDQEIVRSGITRLLSDDDSVKVVAEAADGEEAVHLFRKAQPDVILMDLQMPGGGGLQATRKILQHDPYAKILVLTVCGDDVFPMKVLSAGARGYLTKNCKPEEMLRAIKAVHTGQRYIIPEIAQQLALKRFSGDSSPFDVLSERELQVMLMITKGQKAQEIAQHLHLSPKTINTYRYRLFDKLGVKNDVELTHLAIRHGVIDQFPAGGSANSSAIDNNDD